MSLTNLPKVLTRLKDSIIIQPYARDTGPNGARVRIELRSTDPKDEAFALSVRSVCVVCGAKMHPFRRRKVKGNKVGSIYIAATCPWEVNHNCSRSRLAAEEYLAIRDAMERLTKNGHL